MTTYYVGTGGNDGNSGTSWANRKLTLNGAEDIPVAAGDTVYVGPGIYREMLTVDVSGSSGSPITYIGDFSGANTDGVGGVVRITASDDDIAATRANCITAASKNYRTFRGLVFDMSSSHSVNATTACSSWIVEQCYFGPITNSATAAIYFAGTGTGNTVRRSAFLNMRAYGIEFNHSSTVSDAGHVVENCIFVALNRGVSVVRVGGIAVRNGLFFGGTAGVRVVTALAGGQTVTVNNCLLAGVTNAVQATATGEIVENYNALFNNSVDRSNVDTGANSNAYPPLLDARWFMKMAGA